MEFMNSKKHFSGYIIFAAVFCLLYILLAIKPLGKEYQFEPEWKIDVTNPALSENSENEPLLPFKLGQTMGYFTPDGKVVNFITFPQKSSISKFGYTFYSFNNSSATFFYPDGKKIFTSDISGFPMLNENRIFTFLPGGSSFSMCDENGKSKWEYSGAVPITAFESSESGIVAGFADGNICQFNMDGTLIQRFAPGGSEIPVILGIAISSDGKYIASVCGQNKQRFILAQKDGAQTKITAHEFLDSKNTNQMLVKFSADDKTVYFNSGNTLGIVDVKTGKKRHLKIEGQAISIQESEKCFFVLTKDGKKYTVYAVEPFATFIGRFSFEASAAFIQVYKNRLYVGKNSTIYCIEIK